jgi:hypothetical protein
MEESKALERCVRLWAFQGVAMDAKQKNIVLGSFIVLLLLWLVSPFLLSKREPALPLSRSTFAFDASRAYATADEFVGKNPHRVLGSLESRASSGFIHDYLADLGYAFTYTHFDARIASRIRVGRNVLAYKKGSSDEMIALVAHYDSAGASIPGTADNASGVAVLLELARIFASAPTHRSLLLIFSDGGEWGSLGAKDIAESYPQRSRIAAVLSLDHVSVGTLAALCLEETGQLGGYTPPWLRRLARESAGRQGLNVVVPSAVGELFERAILISGTDQGPFLKAGIPAINLGSIPADPALEKAVLHTSRDTIENLQLAGIRKYGIAAECIVRSLDELQTIPGESSEYFGLWDGIYVRPAAIRFLHIISFLPFVVLLIFQLKNHRDRLNFAGAGRELLVCLATILPFFSIYFFIGVARALRRIPIYSLYPATAKDPVLMNPPWNVLGIILGAALILAAVFYIIGKYAIRELPKPDFHVSKLILLGLLLIAIILSFLYNSYWALAFLLIPAWVWALLDRGQSAHRRLLNGICILAAGIPYYAALRIYSSRLGMSWDFIWYQVLSLSTGLFSPTAFYLGMAVFALGIRFLVIQLRPGKS